MLHGSQSTQINVYCIGAFSTSNTIHSKPKLFEQLKMQRAAYTGPSQTQLLKQHVFTVVSRLTKQRFLKDITFLEEQHCPL